MTDEWSYNLGKKYWDIKKELKIKLQEDVKDVEKIADLLKYFLEKEALPFKVLDKIQIFYSDKSADANLKEHWSKAFVTIPIMKRSFLKNPRYEVLNGKHYIKVRITLNDSSIETWQEYRWCSLYRWYVEMEQIKAWKEVLEKFSNSLPSLKGTLVIENPSSR